MDTITFPGQWFWSHETLENDLWSDHEKQKGTVHPKQWKENKNNGRIFRVQPDMYLAASKNLCAVSAQGLFQTYLPQKNKTEGIHKTSDSKEKKKKEALL